MPGALDIDMSLDDVIQNTSGEKGKGKGRVGGMKGSGKSPGKPRDKETVLNMSLEELIETEDSGNRGKGGCKGKSKGKDTFKGFKGSWKGSSSKGQSKGYSKGGWDSKATSGGPPPWMEHDDRGDEEDNEDGKGYGKGKGSKGGGFKGGKSVGKGKGADSLDWRSAQRRTLKEEFDASRWSAWDRPRLSESARAPLRSSMRSGGLGPPPRRVAAFEETRGVTRRRVEPEPRGIARSAGPPQKRARRDEDDLSRCKRIKVTNIPRDLGARDIKEAFESEAGQTVTCELERGTCYITFMRAGDAQKAVETFDRGELNGKMITVVLDP